MWGMLLNQPGSAPATGQLSSQIRFQWERNAKDSVCCSSCQWCRQSWRWKKMWRRERSKLFSCITNKHDEHGDLALSRAKQSVVDTRPSSLPVGCPPWRSGSSPPRRCGAAGAGRWSAWPGWRRCPGWSSAAARRTPARDPTSTHWRRRPPPSPWHWPATDRCLSTGCPPERPPASGYPPLRGKRERKVREGFTANQPFNIKKERKWDSDDCWVSSQLENVGQSL